MVAGFREAELFCGLVAEITDTLHGEPVYFGGYAFLQVFDDQLLLACLPESGFEPVDPAPEPEGRVLQAEKSKVLRQALDRLPEEMRTALVLTSMDGQSYEEAAEVLEVPVGTVRSRIARAKLKLQKILLETGNYFGKTASKESEGGRKG